jgi:phage-related baseplate assembly protein
MSKQYQFVGEDVPQIIAALTAGYEGIVGAVVRPASPESLFIRWAASVVVQERINTNYAGNQNIPSRASGANLDALGEIFYLKERPAATPAATTVRFAISEPQAFSVLIPAGTRITDRGATLVWITDKDAYIAAGSTTVDVKASCQTSGASGNGYAPGQISALVDVFPYYDHCENITESGGGANAATDAEFYNLMRLSEDAYRCAGALGAYVYFAKSASAEIADVVPNSPTPGYVNIYALMKDGAIANDETKAAILTACNADFVRPLTDMVSANDPEIVSYNIELTYYVTRVPDQEYSAANVAVAVAAAVNDYIKWQGARLGRDINPDELVWRLKSAGVKRVEISSPVFTVLRDGKPNAAGEFDGIDDSIPQVAILGGSPAVTDGGYEDD